MCKIIIHPVLVLKLKATEALKYIIHVVLVGDGGFEDKFSEYLLTAASIKCKCPLCKLLFVLDWR